MLRMIPPSVRARCVAWPSPAPARSMKRSIRPATRNSRRTSASATTAVIASRTPISPSRSVGGSSERRVMVAGSMFRDRRRAVTRRRNPGVYTSASTVLRSRRLTTAASSLTVLSKSRRSMMLTWLWM